MNTVRASVGTVGIHSLSVDDICGELGISKKTFYVYFSTKDEMIKYVLEQVEADRERKITKWIKQTPYNRMLKDLVQKIKKFTHESECLKLHHDLKKYHFLIYKAYIKQVKETDFHLCLLMVDKGIASGYIKESIDKDAVSYLLSAINHQIMSEYAANPKNTKLRHYHKTIMDMILYGILTEAGEKKLQAIIDGK